MSNKRKLRPQLQPQQPVQEPTEAAAKALHGLLLTKLPPGEARVSWEELPEGQRGETRKLVACVLNAYRRTDGTLP